MKTFQIKHLLVIASVLLILWVLFFLFLPRCQAIEISGLIKDYFSSILAISGAIVAIIGLDTWKQEIKGNKRINLVDDLYSDISKLDYSITKARSVFIPNIPNLKNSRFQNEENEVDENIEFRNQFLNNIRVSIEKPWQDVIERLNRINAYIEKIGLYLSTDLESKVSGLNKYISDIYYKEINPSLYFFIDPKNEDLYKEFCDVKDKYLSYSLSLEEDEFGSKVNGDISEIRSLLKSYID